VRNLEEAEERIADLEEALLKIRQWCNAYPVDVFIPPTRKQIALSAATLRETPGCASSDALHGSWARHILAGVRAYTDIVNTEEEPSR
jgi:hypothetical protein